MLVPGRIFASADLLAKAEEDRALLQAEEDRALLQVENVAHLPGIVRASMAMPDIHVGYGFPIRGVAATDVEEGGVISSLRTCCSNAAPPMTL
jgi:tRNA-splicing ligase RtcB